MTSQGWCVIRTCTFIPSEWVVPLSFYVLWWFIAVLWTRSWWSFVGWLLRFLMKSSPSNARSTVELLSEWVSKLMSASSGQLSKKQEHRFSSIYLFVSIAYNTHTLIQSRGKTLSLTTFLISVYKSISVDLSGVVWLRPNKLNWSYLF